MDENLSAPEAAENDATDFAGAVFDTEPCFELTPEALAYIEKAVG